MFVKPLLYMVECDEYRVTCDIYTHFHQHTHSQVRYHSAGNLFVKLIL